MATSAQQPHDERIFSEPGFIHWWVQQNGQPMDENMIHRYLSLLDFFDHTTKNGITISQGQHAGDPRAMEYIHSRQLIEDGLRNQVGTEYMIAETPKPAQNAQIQSFPRGTTGIYVIRKQDRQRVQTFDGRTAEELTPLETYYTHNEGVYKAGSVADIVGNRLLQSQRFIQCFADQAKELPSFDPAMGGYYYLRPQNKPATAADSTSGTPVRSRETSVAPGPDSQSVRSGSVELGAQGGGDPSAAAQEERLLAESLGMSVQFGGEYMDENPIIGEPGKFSFTSSTAAVKKRKADEEAAAAKAKAEREAKSLTTTPKAEKAPAGPAIMTEAKTARDKDRKGGRTGDRARRKKSKANLMSPVTPGAGPSSMS